MTVPAWKSGTYNVLPSGVIAISNPQAPDGQAAIGGPAERVLTLTGMTLASPSTYKVRPSGAITMVEPGTASGIAGPGRFVAVRIGTTELLFSANTVLPSGVTARSNGPSELPATTIGLAARPVLVFTGVTVWPDATYARLPFGVKMIGPAGTGMRRPARPVT